MGINNTPEAAVEHYQARPQRIGVIGGQPDSSVGIERQEEGRRRSKLMA
jgi:hypothetical protein